MVREDAHMKKITVDSCLCEGEESTQGDEFEGRWMTMVAGTGRRSWRLDIEEWVDPRAGLEVNSLEFNQY